MTAHDRYMQDLHDRLGKLPLPVVQPPDRTPFPPIPREDTT